MDRKKLRSSKLIDLALLNAGIHPSTSLITLDSLPIQNVSEDYNESVNANNIEDMNQKNLKKHVCRKLSFEMFEPMNNAPPDEMLLSASTSPVASTSKAERLAGCPVESTAFEEIEKLISEDAVNIEFADMGIPGTSTLNSVQIAEDGLNTPNKRTQTSVESSTISANSRVDEDLRSGDSKAVKRRGRKRNCRTDKRYIDYLSGDEDFSTFIDCDGADLDSDEWSGSGTSENDDIGEIKTKKKKPSKCKQKKKRVDDIQEEPMVGEAGLRKEKKNTKKERQQKRSKGEEYVRKDGKTVNAKCLQPNPCSGKKCGNNCENISDERRQQVFDHFWKLTVDRRRDWLVSLTQKQAVKRKRTNSDTRGNTFKYHINDGEGRRGVCLQFLAATLDISAKSIYHTVKNSKWGCAKEDLRGKCIPPNKTKPDTIETVLKFIKSLPAVPSHYCRHDSSRVYLPQEFKNIPNVYSIYKKRLEGGGADFVSEKVFRRIFTEEFNIGFHVPKKDKCLKCLKFERSDTTIPANAEEKAIHEIEKNESYNRFFAHKNIHKSDPNTLCVSFDLEKVLNTPHGESMLLYYSRKLAVYNLCFYENGTRRVFCFYWDENNGKRGANEIASVLHRYIKSVDERGNIKNLLLYCDCCPGQNRNRVVLAMIHSTLQECENLETIQINYLLTGHTYMPVDSVHAVIDANLKKTIIYAPSQWYTVFSTARKDPFPYEVEKLRFEDFHKWDSISEKYFKGNLTGKISKIRIATFKKNKSASISVKYTMTQSGNANVIEIQSKTKVPLMSCYRSRLPISKPKYDDLAKLCKDKVIPAHFQHEYLDIPHSQTEKDRLPESDIDDLDI